IALVDQIVEVGDLVVDRAARRARRDRAGAVAIGDAAIHAARGLVARFLLRERNDELLEMLEAIGDRRVLPVMPLDFQKTCHLTHLILTSLRSLSWPHGSRRASRLLTMRIDLFAHDLVRKPVPTFRDHA